MTEFGGVNGGAKSGTQTERNEKGGMNKLLFCPFFLFLGEVNSTLFLNIQFLESYSDFSVPLSFMVRTSTSQSALRRPCRGL